MSNHRYSPESKDEELVLDALLMAVWRRRPTEPVIIHSDQGTQYGSSAWYRISSLTSSSPSTRSAADE